LNGPTADDLTLPVDLRDEELTEEEARARLESWGHPRPRRWLRQKAEQGEIRPPRIRTADLWRALLKDECDKLYNQAWCALDSIRNAEDEESVLLLAMDDLPSAVEQAFSLAPPLAGEHLLLLRQHKEERHADFLRELGVGTEREERERIDCLAFWEENAEDMSDLRRTLLGLVRRELQRRSEGG
jgi:hypothetical protein